MPGIVPGPRGMITRDQAAQLCDVSPDTISQWVRRGHLKVAWRYKGRIMLDPVEVARAELATRKRARRYPSVNAEQAPAALRRPGPFSRFLHRR